MQSFVCESCCQHGPHFPLQTNQACNGGTRVAAGRMRLRKIQVLIFLVVFGMLYVSFKILEPEIEGEEERTRKVCEAEFSSALALKKTF